jgi:hypothetical protein
VPRIDRKLRMWFENRDTLVIKLLLLCPVTRKSKNFRIT